MKKYITPLLMAIMLTSSANASWLKDRVNDAVDTVTKPVDKAVEWAGKQSGITTTNDKINDAASETKETNQQLQSTLTQVTPVVTAAAESIKKTSDGLSELVQLLKWPLFALCVVGIFWLAGKALIAWKVSPAAAVIVLVIGAALWFGGKLAAEGKLHFPANQPAVAVQN